MIATILDLNTIGKKKVVDGKYKLMFEWEFRYGIFVATMPVENTVSLTVFKPATQLVNGRLMLKMPKQEDYWQIMLGGYKLKDTYLDRQELQALKRAELAFRNMMKRFNTFLELKDGRENGKRY